MKRNSHNDEPIKPGAVGQGSSGKTQSRRSPARAAKGLSASAKATAPNDTLTRQTKGNVINGPLAAGRKSAASSGPVAPAMVDLALSKTKTQEEKSHAATLVVEALIRFRSYQQPVFLDRSSGILVLHWSRQIGKSFTLAAWAVDRLLTRPGRLVTVLSNSRDNGAEFVAKCAEVCNLLGIAQGASARESAGADDSPEFYTEDMSPDIKFENMRMEVRVAVGGKMGRIKVLAANPRTARGFSGDLILDEFAFHENSPAIWEAAEPILSSNPDFLCRIASTGNGKHNMFYRMAAGPGPNDGTPFLSSGGFRVSRVTRTEAWKQGVKVYDPNTRKPIHPDEARAKSLDKRAYDQNYECQFADENMALLTYELICAAEREGIPIDTGEWSPVSLARMFRAKGTLQAGQDFARNGDLSVLTVIERDGELRRIVGILRMENKPTPHQNRQLALVCNLPRFERVEIDMTGNGLGLYDYAVEEFGPDKIGGVNFASTEPVTELILAEGRKNPTARVTEIMATDMRAVFQDRAIEIPLDQMLRDDLRKPEKVVSPGGRVSIAASRDESGHADHFWSIALAIRAGNRVRTAGTFAAFGGVRTERSLEG
jgi:phage FluMu gp28-like protein